MNASIFSRLTPEEITALHETWKNDPLSVDPLWAAYFEGYELGSGGAPREEENAADASPYTVPPESAEGRGRVNQLIRAYRVMGHKCARFNPLDSPEEATVPVRPEELASARKTWTSPSTSAPSRKGASSPSGKSSPTSGTPIAGPSDLNTSTLTTWKSAPGLRKK